MKKLAAISTTILTAVTYLYSVTSAYAQTIKIDPPKVGSKPVGYTDISNFLNNAITLIFIIALVGALIMLVWGAVEWIFSGGNKEALTNAKGRIIHALAGLAILAIAFAIINLAGGFLGFNLMDDFTIPSPASPKPT